MLWLPSASVEVVRVAEPPLSATVPRAVPPLVNVTLPVGMTAPEPGSDGRGELRPAD